MQPSTCPYCHQAFPAPSPSTPVALIGQDFRDHLSTSHPLQSYDLQTTRWHNGEFVRCEPEQPGTRHPRERRQPRGGHGFARLVRMGGEPESDTEWVVIVCHCGWQSASVFGESLAWHELRVHFRNDCRLTCPYCDWRWEEQERDPAEREMARHIGILHPDRFPWGYT